jgi:hypothetical protein
MPTDASASAVRGTLVSRALGVGYCFRLTLIPLQGSTGKGGLVPYFDSSTEHVRRNHSMCDLSSHMTQATGTTDFPNKPPQCVLYQPSIVDMAPPDHEPVVSPSTRTLHCREARVPLSTSTANIRTAPYEGFDEPSGGRYRRISVSYDWLFNSPLGQQSNDFGVDTLDLVGPDPFRWVPTRAHISQSQRDFQVPESTASGALALTVSSSTDQVDSIPKMKYTKPRYKMRRRPGGRTMVPLTARIHQREHL